MNFIPVPEEVKQKALASLESHPPHAEAMAWSHCVIDVQIEHSEFIKRTRFPEEDKRRIASILNDESDVLVVSYFTADQEPKPLSGGGKHYISCFIQRRLR